MGRVASSVTSCLTRGDDLRSPAAHAAFARIAAIAETERAVVSIGGGPLRVHPRFVNLNIVMDRGVDLRATAYALPFADGTLAAIHCEAVLEHLEFPQQAVDEMHRVLAPGGLVYAATPFLQAYHAYPDHFQNFTLNGHTRLFERAGFAIEDAGVCVGPTFAMVDLAANYVRELLPGRLLSRGAERIVRTAGRLLRLADIRLTSDRNARVLCSSTFVLGVKSVSQAHSLTVSQRFSPALES